MKHDNGHWETANVPVSVGGVASFDMNAIPPGAAIRNEAGPSLNQFIRCAESG